MNPLGLHLWYFDLIKYLLFLALPILVKGKSELLSDIELQADINSSLNAIAQVQKAFGKYSIETPEIFSGNHRDFEHIKLVKDSELGSAFAFYIHRDEDGDRDKKWPKGKERQRNEIKGYQSSPETLKAKISETHYIKWYLKIEKTFKITKAFCHFFQLKAVGSQNVEDPILTLSGVIEREKPQLQLQWWSGDQSGRIFLADWEDCKDKWLICESVCNYAKHGSFKFSIRSADGVLNIEKVQKLETWRNGFSFVRPKWGIYRSIADVKQNMNSEDQILLNNILVKKI